MQEDQSTTKADEAQGDVQAEEKLGDAEAANFQPSSALGSSSAFVQPIKPHTPVMFPESGTESEVGILNYSMHSSPWYG